MTETRQALTARPEVIYEVTTTGLGVIQQPLSLRRKLANHGGLRKVLVLIALALIWEGYARWISNDLLFPTFSATLRAFWDSMMTGELVKEIVVPQASLRKPTCFLKFGLRKGQALALVNAAASLRAKGEPAAFDEVRIALGAVAPTVMRARAAEAFLQGRAISAEAIAEAARIAAGEARPITDFRASAEYRRDLIAVLVRRALTQACALAQAPLAEAMP